MGEKGLTGVPDPSSFFLGDRLVGAPGSALTVPLEGYRPLVVEVQALVGRSSPVPRRFVTGLDAGRVGFLVAVLEKRAGVPVGDCDVYVSVAGGARACEPAADLAVCLALASSLSGKPLPGQMVALGEVGLGGELRRVNAMPKRLTEARRLGFHDALVPASTERHGARPEDDARPEDGARPRRRELPASTLRQALALALGEGPAVRMAQGERPIVLVGDENQRLR
jgi:DNA repair protein RadA/Sms